MASGHFLNPASHRRFMDHDQRLTDEPPVETSLPQCSAHYRWLIGGPRITSCGSPEFYRCC
ncbi:hypothetical protein HAX54_018318, partial [Datura stramonium]|nr:hypothetical protein [Datura stramonium]